MHQAGRCLREWGQRIQDLAGSPPPTLTFSCPAPSPRPGRGSTPTSNTFRQYTVEIETAERCEAGQPEDFAEGLFVHHLGKQEGAGP